MDKRKKKSAKKIKSEPRKAPVAAQAGGVFNLTQLGEIVSLMSANDLSLVNLEQAGVKLELRRGADTQALANLLSKMPVGYAPAPAVAAPAAPVAAPAAVAAAPAAAASDGPAGPSINSPMVGTFYRSSAPGEKAFVSVGDSVDENTTVCIIEAMKVMNEIKAEARGVVTRVLAEDGKPVQYGQPLFELKA
jgi:acetyl-CoA carboxylase biotin carboxyl carrier protein